MNKIIEKIKQKLDWAQIKHLNTPYYDDKRSYYHGWIEALAWVLELLE